MIAVASLTSALAVLATLFLSVRYCKRPVAAFHRRITNRITRRFASRLPGFAIVTSVGRKSGKLYGTPVNVFRKPGGFVIALTYGRDSGWVSNVLAVGGCEVETRGIRYKLSAPVIVHDPSLRQFPLIVRLVLRLIDANDFLELAFEHPTSD